VCDLRISICRLLQLLAFALLLVACGGKTSDDDATGGTTSTTPACQWPANFNPSGASVGDCVAAHKILSCDVSDGIRIDCLSDDGTTCTNNDTLPSNAGIPSNRCEWLGCAATEYALRCGATGPGPWAQPPSTCHLTLSTPGGTSYSCCDCEP
jgi:hypothetical protein